MTGSVLYVLIVNDLYINYYVKAIRGTVFSQGYPEDNPYFIKAINNMAKKLKDYEKNVNDYYNCLCFCSLQK